MFPEGGQIRDPGLAEKVVAPLAALLEKSEWERVEDIPINAKTPETSLLTHIRFAARAALALAEAHRELYGMEMDTDILLVAALVHDGNIFVNFQASSQHTRATCCAVKASWPRGMWVPCCSTAPTGSRCGWRIVNYADMGTNPLPIP